MPFEMKCVRNMLLTAQELGEKYESNGRILERFETECDG